MSNNSHRKIGTLHVITGPMFSGKTNALIKSLRGFKMANRKVLVINHTLDDRTENSVVRSHQNETFPALKIKLARHIFEQNEYKSAEIIVIDEAQFFDDLLDVVIQMVEHEGKHVIVAGLDGKADRTPFGDILKLLPYADSVERLSAYCVDCDDGMTAAHFSKCIDNEYSNRENGIMVGSAGLYKPVCRKHFLLLDDQ